VKFFEHDIIDSVTLILLRLSTTTDNQQTPPSSSGSPEHMGRKATILFRIAMQPDLFGNIASIKTELYYPSINNVTSYCLSDLKDNYFYHQHNSL
jgi:hypothetical protein